MIKNMLVVITGQMREYQLSMASQIQMIRDTCNRYKEQTGNDLVPHYLVVTWDKSFSLYPMGYYSFIEDSTEPAIRRKMECCGISNARIKVVPLMNASKKVILRVGTPGMDDFSYVAYLNQHALLEMLAMQRTTKFDMVMRIRPDLFITGDLDLSKVDNYSVFIPNPFDPIYTFSRQYHDGLEVFGVNAYMAYGQMMSMILSGAIDSQLFVHTWVLAHLAYFGVAVRELDISSVEYNVIRPTVRYLPNDIEITHRLAVALDLSWRTALSSNDRHENIFAEMNDHGVKFRRKESNIRLVIFDIDGVLVDSVEANDISLRETMREFGFDDSDDNLILKNPIPTTEKIKYLERTQNKKLTDDDVSRFLVRKFENLMNHKDDIVVNPHAKQAIIRILNSNQIVAIATNARREYAVMVLTTLGLTPRHFLIAANDTVERAKPAPDMYESLIRQARTTAESTLVIDDTVDNLDTAAKLGCEILLVNDFDDLKGLK